MDPARVMVVDGMSVFKTATFAMTRLTNGYAFNFINQLSATLKKFPDIAKVIVTWEGGHDRRSAIYPDYKKDRPRSRLDLRQQRDLTQSLLEAIGIDQVHAKGYEGDDMGAWLVHNLGCQVLLYTNDQDWLQLIAPGISVYQKTLLHKSAKERIEITRSNFEALTGWTSPEMYLTAKCIMGDKDEIPGMPRVGDDLTRAYLMGGALSDGRRKKIEEFVASPDFQRNMLLADLRTPQNDLVPIWRLGQRSEEQAQALLTEAGFASILKKFPEWWELYSKV